MSYFKGCEIFSLDNKGRVNVPSKMRKALSPEAEDTFTVTRGVDQCIVAYPNDEWKKYALRLQELNQFDPKNRYVIHTINMWCDEVVIDAQQRIMLPKRLLEFAEIETKIIIVGMIDHIAFWNPDLHDEYLKSSAEPYEAIAEQVMSYKL